MLEDKVGPIKCGGTNVNTGYKRGAMRCLEMFLKRPLQWVICELHLNGLALHHIFMIFDGSTKSPDKFSGAIGSKLNGRVSEWNGFMTLS